MTFKQFISFLSLFLSCLVTPAFATTLQKLTFEEIVNVSELIIEGEVKSVYPVDDEGMLGTRVLIKVLEVLKGNYPGGFLELEFLGGNEGSKTVVVSGQDIPVEGEHAFYFIENATTRAVNPLTGWSQGHFKILKDIKGNQYLETDIQQELVEITKNKKSTLANKLTAMKFSQHLVDSAYYTPVTPDELRDAVSGFMAAGSL